MIIITNNVTLENSSGLVLSDTSETINPYLTKTGPTNSSAGAEITYEITHGNAGTDDLTSYKVTDALPTEVEITIVACTLNTTQIPSYSLYITTSSDEETEILVLEDQTEDSGKIDLTTYLSDGETVSSVIFVGASCSATTVTDYSKIYLYGTVIDDVEEDTTILNIAKTSVSGEGGAVGRNIGCYTTVETTLTPPIIIAEDLVIGLGSTFYPRSGVSAVDGDGNDLTSSIEVITNTVDTSSTGTYLVTYKVTDSQGHTVEKNISVTVVEAEESTIEQAITDVIGSVALEEAAIYGILDAEGAKIQKAVALDLTQEELLAVNSSVESMIESLTSLELVLLEKLNIVTSAT